MWLVSAFIPILLAGFAQLPPSPQDIQAKKFEAVPDKAVIYLVRDYPDFGDVAATIWLGDKVKITTYPGTYYRWEVAPGTHRIAGQGVDIGTIAVKTERGRIYYVLQRTAPLQNYARSHFSVVTEPVGRAAVRRAVLVGGG